MSEIRPGIHIIADQKESGGIAIRIINVVAIKETGNDVLIFDGEKWYPKTKRFEDIPEIFELRSSNAKELRDCLDKCTL